jgi:Sulfotransferase family
VTDIESLIPLLVAGYGRSGTTALMALLGTDGRVAMGRVYPFEARPLSYSAKMALLLSRNAAQSHVGGEKFFSYEDCALGAPPWLAPEAKEVAPGDIGSPSAVDWFQNLWASFAGKLQIDTHHPQPMSQSSFPWYAEKVAAWVPAFVRSCLPARTLYLFRDPRDMYLSANALMKQRKYFSFARGPQDSDLDHARNLAYEFLLYFENFRADKNREDCLLIQYADLVRDLSEVAKRLQDFAGLCCLPSEMPQDLGFHRTASSPEASIDRWRREALPKGVLNFLETYLQESFAALQYPFAEKPRVCPGVEFRTSDESGVRVALNEGGASVDVPLDPLEARSWREIWISLYGPSLDQVGISWRSGKQDYSEGNSQFQPWYGARHWRVLRFPVGQQERWQGRITGLRVELRANPAPDPLAYLRWVRLIE